jgi:hypothetical protein
VLAPEEEMLWLAEEEIISDSVLRIRNAFSPLAGLPISLLILGRDEAASAWKSASA